MMYQFGENKLNLSHVYGISDIQRDDEPSYFFVRVYFLGTTIISHFRGMKYQSVEDEVEKLVNAIENASVKK